MAARRPWIDPHFGRSRITCPHGAGQWRRISRARIFRIGCAALGPIRARNDHRVDTRRNRRPPRARRPGKHRLPNVRSPGCHDSGFVDRDSGIAGRWRRNCQRYVDAISSGHSRHPPHAAKGVGNRRARRRMPGRSGRRLLEGKPIGSPMAGGQNIRTANGRLARGGIETRMAQSGPRSAPRAG